MAPIDRQEAIQKIREYGKWYHGFEILPGIWTEGEYNIGSVPEYLSSNFNIHDISGKRILDIATFDGGFAFGFEKMGAQVVASDIIDQTRTGFLLAKNILNSSVEFFKISVYDLNSDQLGKFDYVHYSGLHYHLKHPVLALEKINAVLKPNGIVFGHGTSGEYHYRTIIRFKWLDKKIRQYLNKLPIAYYLDGSFNNDPTNWFLFNDSCMKTMFIRAGFQPDFVKSKPATEFGHRSVCYFKCVRAKDPDQEYWPDSHKQLFS